MRLTDAFRETKFRFRLKSIELSEASGLSPNQISSFEKGGNLRSDSLDKLLEGMGKLRPESPEFMLSLVVKTDLSLRELETLARSASTPPPQIISKELIQSRASPARLSFSR